MSAITIDGDLVHYEKLGRGRPVILVHGWLGSWRYWIPLMQQLHLKYSVYTLDLVGFGDSAKNPQRYSVEKHVQLLTDFLDQLAIPKAAFIGHGLGAQVVAEFALQNAEKAARLLLVSAPLFDPGDLKERTPAGQRVLLTPSRDRFSLAPQLPEDATLAKKPEPSASNPTQLADERTFFRKPPISPNAPSTPPATPQGNDLPTIGRLTPSDRERLLQAAAARTTSATTPPANATPTRFNTPSVNHLQEAFAGKTPLTLLDKCFKKSEAFFEKMRPDVEKQDEKALLDSTQGYNAGRFLDTLRKITAPTLAVHGMDDPVMPVPNDAIWQYLTLDKEDMFLPIPVPTVRHFPMLEYEPFTRLTTDFLEASEISKLEIRERWRRRTY